MFKKNTIFKSCSLVLIYVYAHLIISKVDVCTYKSKLKKKQRTVLLVNVTIKQYKQKRL